MAACVVLRDSDVHEVLISLSRDEISLFIEHLTQALEGYSVSGEREYQPEPSIVNRPDGRKNLFRLFTSSSGIGVKIIVDPSAALLKERTFANEEERSKMMGLHGVLTLCDQNGFPSGFINAEEVTGYRTSLCALLLYLRRRSTAQIVIFGAGKQALWHARLILALRGHEIHKITFVNRSAGTTNSLVERLKKENDARWKSPVTFHSIITSDSNPNHQTELEESLGQADAVFCTTPSREVLFPARFLTSRNTGCYVSAIGSWQANMIELDPEILKHAVQRPNHTGVVIADDRKECLHGSGEIIQSKLGSDDIEEVGEVLRYSKQPQTDAQRRTIQCLEDGFVVYKSVGVSLTDLAVGQALVEIAQKRNLGIKIPDF